MNSDHPHYHVSCAVIRRDGLIMATQRSSAMTLPLKWEFPGGKIDPGETAEESLHRELQEELGISICVDGGLSPVTHRYPTFTVTLYPFICSIDSGEIVLHEHAALAWLPPGELLSLDWADADVPVVEALSHR